MPHSSTRWSRPANRALNSRMSAIASRGHACSRRVASTRHPVIDMASDKIRGQFNADSSTAHSPSGRGGGRSSPSTRVGWCCATSPAKPDAPGPPLRPETHPTMTPTVRGSGLSCPPDRRVGRELARRDLRGPHRVSGTLADQRETAQLVAEAAGFQQPLSQDPHWNAYDHVALLNRCAPPPEEPGGGRRHLGSGGILAALCGTPPSTSPATVAMRSPIAEADRPALPGPPSRPSGRSRYHPGAATPWPARAVRLPPATPAGRR